jgi:hypothetical protein
VFFEKLDKKSWLLIREKMKKEEYYPGETIYKRGDKAIYFYIIKKGSVYFELGPSKEELKEEQNIETKLSKTNSTKSSENSSMFQSSHSGTVAPLNPQNAVKNNSSDNN